MLPLDNLSGDPAQDYFADGMTDELTTMLAKNSTLRIVSRTSVMQYKRVHRPLPTSHVSLGWTVFSKVGRSLWDHVHMTIQLIQAPSDTHLWQRAMIETRMTQLRCHRKPHRRSPVSSTAQCFIPPLRVSFFLKLTTPTPWAVPLV